MWEKMDSIPSVRSKQKNLTDILVKQLLVKGFDTIAFFNVQKFKNTFKTL